MQEPLLVLTEEWIELPGLPTGPTSYSENEILYNAAYGLTKNASSARTQFLCSLSVQWSEQNSGIETLHSVPYNPLY